MFVRAELQSSGLSGLCAAKHEAVLKPAGGFKRVRKPMVACSLPDMASRRWTPSVSEVLCFAARKIPKHQCFRGFTSTFRELKSEKR